MKILLWALQYLPSIGGIEIITHALAKQLQSMDHEVLVISNSNLKPAEAVMYDGVRVVTFPFTKALLDFNLKHIKEILEAIHQLMDGYAPDILHIHGWIECNAYFQVRILEKKKIPLILTLHCFRTIPNYRTVQCLRLWAMASSVTTVCHSMVKEAESYGYLPYKKVRCIYNGLAMLKAPIKKRSICFKKNILALGRLADDKGFDIAFYAIQLLLEKHPDVRLTLVGGGLEFNALMALRNQLNLQNYIEMTNYVAPGDAIYAHIDAASIILLPSTYDVFPLVAIETAMRGRPIIASRVGGLPEMVVDGETGLLVAPKNPQALAEAIDQLLSDPKKMHEMGVNAKKRARQFFTAEKMTEQYVSLYQALLGA
ncbi:MAG: glycosyltransferase family 4 protein [Coxiellaceae bacterium]|nr:glycosyltransferase family 4 protein [Coxiellaceae bacterium]